MSDLLNNHVNLNSFNAGVMKGGGKPINISKNRVNILQLILILIKLLKIDYKKKSKKIIGGTDIDDLTKSDLYSKAFYYGDLKYDNHTFPSNQYLERDTY